MPSSAPLRSALLLAASVVASIGCRPPVAPDPSPSVARPSLAIEVVPAEPTIAPRLTLAGLAGQLVFHVNLHNRGRASIRLDRVEIALLNRSGVVRSSTTLRDRALARQLAPLAWIVVRDRQTFAAAHRLQSQLRRRLTHAVIPPGGAVALLDRRRSWRSMDDLATAMRIRVHTNAGVIERRAALRAPQHKTALRLPFAGAWQVLEAYRPEEHHSRLLLVSQAFAYDLVVTGAGGVTHDGDRREPDAYLAHARPVVAVANGTVVATLDDVTENIPVGRRPSWRELLRRPSELAGNHVVIRHIGNEHSAYFHLRPGLTVKPGQSVRAGDLLGHCGNSGNSVEPHLHFQLQRGANPLAATPLPSRFGDFTIRFGRLRVYVPPGRPMPLPSRLHVEPGRAADAIDIAQLLGPVRTRR